VGAGHASALHRPGTSPVHRAAPEVKIVSTFLFVLCAVGTPREVWWAFAGLAAVLVVVCLISRIPLLWWASRLVIEVPFVVLAFLLPFTAPGPEIQVLGVGVSHEGLLAGWNILAKGTVGLGASLLLAATTAPPELLLGLRRLRAPKLLTTIAALMLRYAEVLVAEARRMRLARISRGHDPRFLWQVGATARGVGTLFLRSYERGERVHLAMISRGFTGAMPEAAPQRTPVGAWGLGLLPAVAAALTMGAALWNA